MGKKEISFSKAGTVDDLEFTRSSGAMPSKYDALVEAVAKLRHRGVILVEVPQGKDPKLFRGAIKQAIVRYVPEDVSKSKKFEVRLTKGREGGDHRYRPGPVGRSAAPAA